MALEFFLVGIGSMREKSNMLAFGNGLIIYGDELTTLDRCVAAAAVVDRMNGLSIGKNAFNGDCWNGMADAIGAMGFAVRTEKGKVIELDWDGDPV